MPEFDPITIGQDRQKALRELLSKTWGELETLEQDDRVLFPHSIIRVRSKGARESIPVMLRVPREHETRKARLQARAWAEREKLNPALDADLFDNLDTLCLLSHIIRNTTAPFEPWEPDPEILERSYDRVSLDAVWARVEALRKCIDPRASELDEASFTALVAMIAKKAEIDPLAVLDSDGQASFIVLMAKRLASLQDCKS